jgi:hypothetical protein
MAEAMTRNGYPSVAARFASSPPADDPRRYVLLQSDDDDGLFLSVGEGGALETTKVFQDEALWTRRDGGGFVSAVSPGVALAAASAPRDGAARLQLGAQAGGPYKLSFPDGGKVAADGGVCATGGGGGYTAFGGPLGLMSAYSKTFHAQGYVVRAPSMPRGG